MLKDDFQKELPTECRCGRCSRVLQVQWDIRRHSALEWMGIGLAKCDPCDWLNIAATGSDEAAYVQAQKVRMLLVEKIGLKADFFLPKTV